MKSVILGTDWWDDCDDAVALRVLARAHAAKLVQLKGVAINACMDQSVASLCGFLEAEGVGDIPVGIDGDATDFGGRLTYQYRLASLCRGQKSNKAAVDAIRFYRQILHDSPEPLEIIEIGFLQVVSGLLSSQPDDISPLPGVELVTQKVRKFWVMAGRWDIPEGKENNFARNQRARTAAHNFCKKCPVPITFLGWEIGNDVITGSHLAEDDLLHQVLCDHGSPNGRKSWDPMLVLLAITGDAAKAGYRLVKGRASVNPESGLNRFDVRDDGNHAYVVKTKENSFYADRIDSWIESR